MGSPYAVAGTRAAEVANVNTLASFTMSAKITSKLVNTNSANNYLSIVGVTAAVSDGFPTPRTEIGRKLLEHRRKSLARGMKLLTADEINAMVNSGRGNLS